MKSKCNRYLSSGWQMAWLVFVQANLVAADWTQFRGPKFGDASDYRIPTHWSEADIVWKTPLGGPGGSSPVIYGDRIYLTYYSGYGIGRGNPGDPRNLKRHVVCIDLQNGQIIWKKTIGAKSGKNQFTQWAVALHGYASSTPAVDEEAVYVFFGDAGCIAFNHDGTQKWKYDCGTRTHMFGSGASPVIYRNYVIVNASPESNSLLAIDKATGREVWRKSGIEQAWDTPAIYKNADGKSELAISIEGRVLGINPETGEELWSCSGINGYVCPSIVVDESIVYAAGGRNQKRTLAIRSGGVGNVSASHTLWELPKGSNVGSPVSHEGYLFWAKEDGVVYCVNQRTGEIVYEERLSPKSGLVYASPLVAGGNLYYVSRENGTFVVAAKPNFEMVAHNVIGDDESIFNGSPVPVKDGILLRSNKYLYRIEDGGTQ